jgi:mono/diheme cytochrome c family protein
MCAQCHGLNYEGTSTAPPLKAEDLRARFDDQQLFSMINDGILTVAMPGVGHMFSEKQVKELITLIAGKSTGASAGATPQPAAGAGDVSFAEDVLPVFQARCSMCHGSAAAFGGWDGSSYETVMTTGDTSPEIIPGDADNSFLVQLLLETNGVLMPPTGRLSQEEIDIIVNWINAGAEDN